MTLPLALVVWVVTAHVQTGVTGSGHADGIGCTANSQCNSGFCVGNVCGVRARMIFTLVLHPPLHLGYMSCLTPRVLASCPRRPQTLLPEPFPSVPHVLPPPIVRAVGASDHVEVPHAQEVV